MTCCIVLNVFRVFGASFEVDLANLHEVVNHSINVVTSFCQHVTLWLRVNCSKRLFGTSEHDTSATQISYMKMKCAKGAAKGHFLLPADGAMSLSKCWHVEVFRAGLSLYISHLMKMWACTVKLLQLPFLGKSPIFDTTPRARSWTRTHHLHNFQSTTGLDRTAKIWSRSD